MVVSPWIFLHIIQIKRVNRSLQYTFVGSRGNKFIVLFMKANGGTAKNVYITSNNGVLLNITTSPSLDACLKFQIDRTVTISQSHHIILPPELELNSFQKEVKSMLIETSDLMA